MNEPLALALVGCGSMMGGHVKGYRELWEHDLRDFRLIATCDVDVARAERMADDIADFQGTRPTVYGQLEDLLAGERDLAAVDISTVHREHHALAVPCLQAGKHVIIEKPLAITMRAGKLMLETAEQAGTVFQVAENYRRSPEQRAIRWAIRQGRLGQLRMIFWLDVRERLWYWAWREHRDQAGGGWPLDGGVHFADLFRFHIGDVREVFCHVRAYHPVRYENEEKLEGPIEVDVEDTTFATLTFEDSDLGQDVLGEWISTSAAPAHEWSRRAIYGEQGCLDWNEGLKTRSEEKPLAELVEEYRATLVEDESERLFPRGITNGVTTELWEFVRACLTGSPVETDGLEGYKAEAICFALYESAEVNRPVTIAEIENLELEGYQHDLNEGLGLV